MPSKTKTPENITIRAPKDWLDKLDAWRATQPVPPTRAELIRIAVDTFIKAHR